MIDEKELIMEIANWQESLVPHNDTQDKIIWDTLESVIKTISSQPTVYDVDNVVERLKEKVKEVSNEDGIMTYEADIHRDGIIAGIDIAIEIMKNK